MQIYNFFAIFASKMQKVVIKMLLTALFVLSVTILRAQQCKEEIFADIHRSASNYLAYPGPQHPLTPAPEGMTPFYISHYGRHGSRYHNKPSNYDPPLRTMATADSLGKLTPLGRDVLRRLALIREDAFERWGELTTLGARQHREIMRRMTERFPEIFNQKVTVDARSTTVGRCILSMENALCELLVIHPQQKIHHNATHRDMDYLNQQDKKLFAMKMDSASLACYTPFSKKYRQTDRLMQSLFNDTAYVRQHVNAGELNDQLFKLASNLQNSEIYPAVTLYDIFTKEELYNNWKRDNAWWYIAFGGSTINDGLQPYTQRNLLYKLIADGEEVIQKGKPYVHLRFGHETIILPLVCLLDLNGYGLATDDLESLEKKGWYNYKIFPMASNVQFIFYRRNPKDRDVLFKVLLNEDEARLPLKSDTAPYYRWEDFKEYCLRKLEAYEATYNKKGGPRHE